MRGLYLFVLRENTSVIAPNGRVLTGADGTRIAPNFATFFKERISDRKVEAYEIDNLPTKEQVEEAVKKAKERELIICCTHKWDLSSYTARIGT